MTPETGPGTPAWSLSEGDTAYLDKTLRHGPVELGLDESVSWRVLFNLWLRGFLVSGAIWAVFFFIAFLVMITSSGEFDSYSSSSSLITIPAASSTLYGVGSLLAFLVFWLIVLASRFPEAIAEWRVLLADRAMKADSVYSQISGTLRTRQYPVGGTIRRMRVGRGFPVSNRLALRDGHYTAYVSVFPYGTSLYLGWTMWRTRRGAALIGQFLSDLFAGLANGRDPERQMMRTERIRAMREAVHAACREGLVVATEGTEVPEVFGFPTGMPMIEDEFDSAPLYNAPYPAPPMPGVPA